MPRRVRPRAKATMPALSETLRSACLAAGMRRSAVSSDRQAVWRPETAILTAHPFTAHGSPPSEFDAVHPHLLAQGVAIDAEHVGGMRLISLDTMQDRLYQRLLDAADHHVVYVTGFLAVEILEITIYCASHDARHLVFVVHAASA